MNLSTIGKKPFGIGSTLLKRGSKRFKSFALYFVQSALCDDCKPLRGSTMRLLASPFALNRLKPFEEVAGKCDSPESLV